MSKRHNIATAAVSAAGKKRSTGEARPNLAMLLLLGILPLFLAELVRIPVLEGFEDTAYDARMRLRARLDPRPISDDIRIVGVSMLDERRLGHDLETRQAYIDLLDRLARWGARSVTFDIFFDRELATDDLFALTLSSQSLPAILAYSFTDTPRFEGSPPEDFLASFQLAGTSANPAEVRAEMLAVHDYLLQLRAMERQDRRGEGERLSNEQRRELQELLDWSYELRDALLQRWFMLAHGAEDSTTHLDEPFSAPGARLSAPPLMLAAQRHGFANIEKGDEEVVRRVPLVYTSRGRVFPQLTLAAALEHYGVDFADVKIHWGRDIRFTPTRNAENTIRIPIDARGRYLVNFREGEEFLQRNPTLTPVVRDAVGEEFFGGDPAEFFRDRFVIVGEVIAGGTATDVEPIPLQAKFPMVGLHANILDNILKRDFLHVPALYFRLAGAAILGGIAALLFFLFPFGRAVAMLGALAAIYLFGQYLLFQNLGFVLPVVKPIAGMILASLLFFGYVIVVKDRDRRLVRDVFLKSVSPRIGEEILRNYHDEAIWGAQREISVLFVDVRGYTTLSERHGPETVLRLLERFYDTVSESVFRHDGQVNKFLGDAVLALFGALPEEGGDHAARALRSALEIQRALRELNAREFEPNFGFPIKTGAGVNTGEATVGLVGRRRIRIEYTALGDAVNVASRLQTTASEGEVIVSASTVERLGGEQALASLAPEARIRRESVALKGKEKPLTVYRLVLPSNGEAQETQQREARPSNE